MLAQRGGGGQLLHLCNACGCWCVHPRSSAPVNSICVHEGVLRHFEVLKELLREGEHQTDSEEEPTAFEGWGATDHFDHNTRSAMPLVLHHRVHEVSGLRRMHSTVLFYINSGLLTCVDPAAGRIVWQTETDSVFRGHNEREGATEALDQEDGGVSLRGTAPHDRATYHHYPHLVPFAVPASQFHQKTSKVGSGRSVLTTKDKPYVLVVGDNVLTAVKSATGKIEAEIDLDEAVIAPLVLGDFNSDGSKDIIAISRNAYYGFITYQQVHTSSQTQISPMPEISPKISRECISNARDRLHKNRDISRGFRASGVYPGHPDTSAMHL